MARCPQARAKIKMLRIVLKMSICRANARKEYEDARLEHDPEIINKVREKEGVLDCRFFSAD